MMICIIRPPLDMDTSPRSPGILRGMRAHPRRRNQTSVKRTIRRRIVIKALLNGMPGEERSTK